MLITEKKLRNIIRNIVLENRTPEGDKTTTLSKKLRKKFPDGKRFQVNSETGLEMSPDQFCWVLEQEDYRNTKFRVEVGSKGEVFVHFD
jgi:hypothetical protein